MKSSSIFIIVALVAMSALHVNGQSQDASLIKILPGAKPGFIKLIYGMHVRESVNVKFSTRLGEVCTDRIKGDPHSNGMVRRYDVRQLKNSHYWIEISSPRMTAVFHIVPSKDKRSFVAHLEKEIYYHDLVALK